MARKPGSRQATKTSASASLPLVSFAQNFEDVMLWRLFRERAGGSYLDIGAQDPCVDSVSKLFYDRGWRGVNVDANPYFAERFRTERADEVVIQAAVTDRSGPLTLFATTENGMSTGVESIAREHKKNGFAFREVVVPVIRLDELLGIAGEVQWMKVDVEGMEAEVLRSWGDSAIRPWVVVIEATAPTTQIPVFEDWENLLTERDYIFAQFDGLSRWYIHKDHLEFKQLLRIPPNYFDQFQLTANHFAANDLLRIAQKEAERREREVTASYDALMSEFERRGDEILRAQGRISQLEHNVNSSTLERDAAVTQATQYGNEVTTIREQQQALAHELESARGELRHFASRLEEKDTCIREMTSERSKAQECAEALEEERNQIASALQQRETECKELHEHSAQATAYLRDVETRHSKVSDELATATAHLQAATAERDALIERVSDLDCLVARLEVASSSSAADRDAAVERTRMLEAQLTQLHADLGARASECEELGARIPHLQRKITEMEADRLGLMSLHHRVVEDRDQTIQSARGRIAELESWIDQRMLEDSKEAKEFSERWAVMMSKLR